MTTVSYGRTVTKNYQSERADISMDVPEGSTPEETLAQCKQIVDVFLMIATSNNRKMNEEPQR